MFNYQVPAMWYVTIYQNGQAFYKRFFDEQSASMAAEEYESYGMCANVRTQLDRRQQYQEIW